MNKSIGLIDVDGHAKKKKWGATIYPNLALCKIARWHKQQGDNVEWALPFFHYDVIYKSKIFNFTPDDLTVYDADEVIKGGTGYDIKSSLPDEIDRLQPDYSIYPSIPNDTAYGFLTRGCPNKCPWCVVPRKEGRIRPYMDCEEIAIEGRNKLVLMDNNILAAGEYAIAQMEKIIAKGYKIDFNQALDARLMTDDFARLLAQMKWIDNRIRFGCDTHAQIAECERAMQMINSHGYRGQYFLYTMIGGGGYELQRMLRKSALLVGTKPRHTRPAQRQCHISVCAAIQKPRQGKQPNTHVAVRHGQMGKQKDGV